MQSFLKSGKLDNSVPNSSASSSKTQTNKKKIQAWVEKYRPKTIEDVVEQQEAVNVLNECILGAELPNLLFYGPPGTGKTSTILAAARQLFGEHFRSRILELNASDERGINMIREKVKGFAQLTAGTTMPDGKACPPFKIIILDEADSMTNAAQTALRRTMEKEARSTRFCIICNYISRIIEPITSRCTKFRFKPLNESLIFQRLQYICDEEKVECESESLNKIVESSGGDMRRAITCLQSCATLKGQGSKIDLETVYEITGIIPEKWINDFVAICKNKNTHKIRGFCKTLIYEAYTGSQFFEQLNEYLINCDEFNNKQKAEIGKKLGEASYCLQEGGSEYLQLLNLASGIMKACKIK